MTADRGRRSALLTPCSPSWSAPARQLPGLAAAVLPHDRHRILFYSMLAMSLSFLAGQAAWSRCPDRPVRVLGLRAGDPQRPLRAAVPVPAAHRAPGHAGLAFLFGIISMRTYGTYFLILTLALGQILWAIAQQWTSVTEGFDGIQGTARPSSAASRSR
jgi:branched-chain amino acid transport system permease protein